MYAVLVEKPDIRRFKRKFVNDGKGGLFWIK